VYTHAFMDGWSPGYLGSIAYNHNGMMRMYETQSGRDPVAGAAVVAAGAAGAPAAGRGGRAAAGGRGGRGRGGAAPAPTPAVGANAGGRGGSAAADSTATPGGGRAGGAGGGGGGGGAGGGRAGGPAIPTGRGGGQDREWYRGIQVPTGMPASFTRRNNTNYMQTGVLSALQLTAMFPNLVLENFYVKTRNSIAAGRAVAPYGYVIPAQLDMTRAAELVNILRIQGIEVGQTTASIRVGTDTFPADRTSSRAASPTGVSRRTCSRGSNSPTPRCARMTTAAGRWASRSTWP